MEMMNIITEINRYTSISRERELTNTEKMKEIHIENFTWKNSGKISEIILII